MALHQFWWWVPWLSLQGKWHQNCGSTYWGRSHIADRCRRVQKGQCSSFIATISWEPNWVAKEPHRSLNDSSPYPWFHQLTTDTLGPSSHVSFWYPHRPSLNNNRTQPVLKMWEVDGRHGLPTLRTSHEFSPAMRWCDISSFSRDSGLWGRHVIVHPSKKVLRQSSIKEKEEEKDEEE